MHPNIVNTYGCVLEKKAFVQELCYKEILDFGLTVKMHSLPGLISVLEDDLSTEVKLIALHDISFALSFLHKKGDCPW